MKSGDGFGGIGKVRTAFAFHEINKTFKSKDGSEIVALKDVNYHAEPGQLVSVVGPSGCGKSTLLRILAGIERATSGQVQIAGRESVGPSKFTGIVFQAAVLLPWRTVLENVLLPSEIQKRDLGAARRLALEYLDLVGLRGFASKYPNELSGGMQQRVGIARALVHSPTLLLMDEPFGALDAMTRETMNLELLRIREQTGAAIMLVTHSVPEAVFLGDRVVVMSPRPGRITKTIDIDLPRQRDLKMINSEPFGTYVSDIREHLNATGGID
ncbi:ABC transporter ATP-binding protein [Pandoraea sp. SD6-2]|uniref:ABC transporter ATP-binding protein n=1 Tax=Pandoraea sp. SD6-2 TaxID=1286093 RepID=UPI00032E5616|nr:ABC transporter ATP-binding protein [Pandoraea sp. SD6-2]EON15309.1 NitT/TauT family transport system ATP-binding protein [Pandoraea sp. SD6-2]